LNYLRTVSLALALPLKPDFQLAKNNLAWSLRQKSSAGGKP